MRVAPFVRFREWGGASLGLFRLRLRSGESGVVSLGPHRSGESGVASLRLRLRDASGVGNREKRRGGEASAAIDSARVRREFARREGESIVGERVESDPTTEASASERLPKRAKRNAKRVPPDSRRAKRA